MRWRERERKCKNVKNLRNIYANKKQKNLLLNHRKTKINWLCFNFFKIHRLLRAESTTFDAIDGCAAFIWIRMFQTSIKDSTVFRWKLCVQFQSLAHVVTIVSNDFTTCRIAHKNSGNLYIIVIRDCHQFCIEYYFTVLVKKLKKKCSHETKKLI